jgi:GNAT superfamily N-acetyltransferase
LYALYPDPAWWGHGARRQLHDAALERLAAGGHPAAALWVLRGNARAIRFYRARGRRPDGGAVLEEARFVRTTRTS